MACSLTSRAKPKDKLKLSFEIYDSDENGLLDKEEMQKIIEAVHELYEGCIGKNESLKKVDTIINQYDKDKSGSISKNEFIEGEFSNK
jgi:neuronal calcium sensor 1